MGNSLTHQSVPIVPPQAASSDSQQRPVPVPPPPAEAPPPPLPPLPPLEDSASAAEPPIEYPTAPDMLAAVRRFSGSVNTDTTTMTDYGFPLFLEQALEAVARDAGRSKQHTVAATLDLGLPFLYCIPGVTECLEARQQLLRESRDRQTRLWLDQTVPMDLLTGGLGHKRFTVRVGVAQHRQIGLLAAGLGFKMGQCFTLALTAALIGTRYVPTDDANEAMDRTLVELLERCEERARDMELRLSAPEPEATRVHRTIYDVLAGHQGR